MQVHFKAAPYERELGRTGCLGYPRLVLCHVLYGLYAVSSGQYVAVALFKWALLRLGEENELVKGKGSLLGQIQFTFFGYVCLAVITSGMLFSSTLQTDFAVAHPTLGTQVRISDLVLALVGIVLSLLMFSLHFHYKVSSQLAHSLVWLLTERGSEGDVK